MIKPTKTYVVVIGVLRFREKVLILKRTPNREFSPNKWQPVSGHIGEKEPAEEAVLREVKEETGLDGEIVKAGDVFETTSESERWINVPYLISVETDEAKIDQDEHIEYKWIKPEKITEFDCVTGSQKDLKSVELL